MPNIIKDEDMEKLDKIEEEMQDILKDFCKKNGVSDASDNIVSYCIDNIITNIQSIKIWSNQKKDREVIV